MIVNVISLVIQNIISKNQSLKGCPKKIKMNIKRNNKRKVHRNMNASWKICSLAVNGQSFLVIDGYLLNYEDAVETLETPFVFLFHWFLTGLLS